MLLRVSDRIVFDGYFRRHRLDSFYHYFPLLYAISKADTPISYNKVGRDLYVWAGRDLVYPVRKIPRAVKKVWISLTKPRKPWDYELYDVNYIYDLEETLSIKNLRSNVKLFEKQHPDAAYIELKPKFTYEFVKNWYAKHLGEGKTYANFGWEMWLAGNYNKFDDIKAEGVAENGRLLSVSIWGKLNHQTAIHLICKDAGVPYTQDFTRYQTYQKMKDEGFKYVNDGSDAGLHGLRVYKLKLRPKFIIPIYSWVRG